MAFNIHAFKETQEPKLYTIWQILSDNYDAIPLISFKEWNIIQSINKAHGIVSQTPAISRWLMLFCENTPIINLWNTKEYF